MASKTLKAVKNQNKELKEAMKNQRQDEKQAKADLAKAKSEAGLFGSKEQRAAVKQAKLNYKREKAETQYGKELQSQGKDVKDMVNSGSRTMGVFHSDKKLAAPARNSAKQFNNSVSKFVESNGLEAPKVTSKSSEKTTSKAEGLMKRMLPDISTEVTKAVEDGLGLG